MICSDVQFRLQYDDLRHCTFDTAEAANDALRTCPPCEYADKETALAGTIKQTIIKWTHAVFIPAQTLDRMANGLSMLCLLVYCVLKGRAFKHL